MVALQNDWPGLALIGIARNCRESFDLLLVDDFLIVEHDRNLAAYKPDVVRLPFARRLAGIHCRGNATIERAVRMLAWRLAVVFQNLHLIAAAQADAAVTV